MRNVRALALAPFLLAAVFACDDEGDAHFTTRVASDLGPTRHAVSVLGVYRDGRMSVGSWDTLARYLEPSLGSAHCDVGYDSLVASNGVLAGAIDDYARAVGPTDDLLVQLGPAVQGELVLVLTIAGKLPEHPTDGGAVDAALSSNGRGGGHRFGRERGAPEPETSQEEPSPLEISAFLFSVALGRSVALVRMQYTGTTLDDAMTRFATKLRKSVPDLRCVGWNWNARIDPERIRAKISE